MAKKQTIVQINLSISEYFLLTDVLTKNVNDRISDLTVVEGKDDFFDYNKRLNHAVAVLASVCEDRIEIEI